MPSRQLILEQLTRLAAEGRTLGLFWHLAVLVGLGLVVSKKWSSRASLAIAAAFPMFTASVVAFAVGSWVNGLVMDLGGLTLVVISRKFTGMPVEPGRSTALVAGAATLTYACFYTHFSMVSSWTDVWMTPLGVLPCPTLALVIGVGLMAGGFGSRAWSLTAALLGAAYSLFGVFVLGVAWDFGLFAAASALALQGVLITKLKARKILITRPPAQPTSGAAGAA